jgi:hypothetical protein
MRFRVMQMMGRLIGKINSAHMIQQQLAPLSGRSDKAEKHLRDKTRYLCLQGYSVVPLSTTMFCPVMDFDKARRRT